MSEWQREAEYELAAKRRAHREGRSGETERVLQSAIPDLELPCFTCARAGKNTSTVVTCATASLIETWNVELVRRGEEPMRVTQFAICPECDAIRKQVMDTKAREASQRAIEALDRLREAPRPPHVEDTDRATAIRWGYGDALKHIDEKRAKANSGSHR